MTNNKKKIFILDTTLRDGAQAEGVSFSVNDKLRIISRLKELGVHYIEAGTPGANPKDAEVFDSLRDTMGAVQNTAGIPLLTAFGLTRRKGTAAANDPQLNTLLAADAQAFCIVGKTSAFHAAQILGVSLEENLDMITETITFLKAARPGVQIIFDAEHFFDGYNDNSKYAMSALNAAARARADVLCLCDTNGGALPQDIFNITKTVCERFASACCIGIHCHNDCGLAAANSIMAVEAGARHVQGTLTGVGERCGNAALSTIIPVLQLKMGYEVLPDERLALLTNTSRFVSEIINENLPRRAPFVGKAAFAHKGGMHIDGVSKEPASFEHIEPDKVGNKRRTLISEQTGRSGILEVMREIAPHITKESPEVAALIQILKEKEQAGYQYEAARCSFWLLARKYLGFDTAYFELLDFSVTSSHPPIGEQSSRATVKIAVDGEALLTTAEGEGPVHALDAALRMALETFYPELKDVRLTDYKVRVLDGKEATGAKVRVLIETTDRLEVWSTVGVGADIIHASWLALVDSLEYKLIKEHEKL